MDGVSSADRSRTGLGEAEVTHLAGLDELGDGPSDVLDRNVGVDAVLVEQVDHLAAQPAQGGVGDSLDLFGAAVDPDERPSSIRHPNLVAITTWSRRGSRASPTSSSLT